MSDAVTPAGHALAGRALRRRNEVLTGVLAVLDADQRRDLQRSLDLLLGAIDAADPSVGHLCRLCDLGDCPGDSCPVTY